MRSHGCNSSTKPSGQPPREQIAELAGSALTAVVHAWGGWHYEARVTTF